MSSFNAEQALTEGQNLLSKNLITKEEYDGLKQMVLKRLAGEATENKITRTDVVSERLFEARG